MAYLFACTTQAYAGPDGLPRIRRTLDWPFQGLGQAVEMAWQSGPAGDFYNATWPGAVGVLTAMAPGRFCAVINQAPMKRRTRGRLGFAYDAALNLREAFAADGWPPDHLLRYAFETCETFDEAVRLIAASRSRGRRSSPRRRPARRNGADRTNGAGGAHLSSGP